jgi:signal transduction histidine kinase
MPEKPTDPEIRSRFQLLIQAGVRINAEHSLKQVLVLSAEFLRKIIDAQYSAIGILDETGSALSDFVTSGISDETIASIGDHPKGKGVLGTLITKPEPLRLENVHSHEDSVGFPKNHPDMKSFLGVPVNGREGPVGNLYLAEKIGGTEFTEEDESIAILFAAQVAVAVENARLYEGTNSLLTEIRELHTSREQFFSTINHELRNALTAVHGWSDLLLRKMGPTAPHAAREVFESAENTLELLDDLLFLNRIQQGRVVPAGREFDCEGIVESVRVLLTETAREKGVSIDSQSQPKDLECFSDPKRLEQLLTNLVAYAVRHCPDDSKVSISTVGLEKESVQIDVLYGGEPIDPEIQSILFEQYVPGDTSRERGTGLGLPLARSLARLLGGDVRVESNIDTGTRFCLTFPRYLPME